MTTKTAPRTSFLTLPRELRQQILLTSHELTLERTFSFVAGKHVEVANWFQSQYMIKDWINTLKIAFPKGPLTEDIDFCNGVWLKRVVESQEAPRRERVAKWLGVGC